MRTSSGAPQGCPEEPSPRPGTPPVQKEGQGDQPTKPTGEEAEGGGTLLLLWWLEEETLSGNWLFWGEVLSPLIYPGHSWKRRLRP